MTILAPTSPRPPEKLRVHVEEAIDAMYDLLEFLHGQETPWHPGEIGFLLTAATHHFLEREGITKPCPTSFPVAARGASNPSVRTTRSKKKTASLGTHGAKTSTTRASAERRGKRSKR